MHLFKSVGRLGRLAVLFTFVAACAMAQSNSAVLVGTVSDSSGAAIVGAKVIVENQAPTSRHR